MRRQLWRGCASLARPAPPPAFVPPAEARLPGCNVPPVLWPRVSRGLHRDAGHPLGAVARAVLGALAMALAFSTAGAQTAYPEKPVHLIVPFPPGGATDAVARIVANRLEQRLGQPIIVDNKVGAGGVVGTDAAAKAPPDGYTLLAVFDNFTTNPLLFKNVASDPVRDFVPITQMVRSYQMLVVPPSLHVGTVGELVALAKARGNALNYATAGAGTSSHLAMELFKTVAGIEPTAIHYKGGNPAMSAIVGAQVDMMLVTSGTGLPNVRAGRLIAVGISSPARNPQLPELQAIAESYPGFETQSWVGLVAPAGTSQAIVTKLHALTVGALADPDVRDKLQGQGYEVVGGSPEAFASLIRADLERWGRVIRERHITID